MAMAFAVAGAVPLRVDESTSVAPVVASPRASCDRFFESGNVDDGGDPERRDTSPAPRGRRIRSARQRRPHDGQHCTRPYRADGRGWLALVAHQRTELPIGPPGRVRTELWRTRCTRPKRSAAITPQSPARGEIVVATKLGVLQRGRDPSQDRFPELRTVYIVRSRLRHLRYQRASAAESVPERRDYERSNSPFLRNRFIGSLPRG